VSTSSGNSEVGLEVATELLNEHLREAEDYFVELGAGVAAQVVLEEVAGGVTRTWLCLMKGSDGFGLFVSGPSAISFSGSLQPLLSASRHYRVLAASKLEALYEAIVGEVDKSKYDVVRAVSEVKAFLDKVRANRQ
jgi:hypothetical protein